MKLWLQTPSLLNHLTFNIWFVQINTFINALLGAFSCVFEDDSSPTGKYTYCYWLWLEHQFGQTIVKVDGTRMQGTHFSGQSRLNLEGMRQLVYQLTRANEQYYRQTQSGYGPSRSALGVEMAVGLPPSMAFAHALHQMYNEFGLTTIERVTPHLINSLTNTSSNAGALL